MPVDKVKKAKKNVNCSVSLYYVVHRNGCRGCSISLWQPIVYL